jgi:anthranilate phosphoribosyltransferase
LGGDPEENAQITRNILAGKTGAQRNVVLINAAAALVAAGATDDLKQGIRLAETSIDSGAAADKMKRLIQYTQENG